MKRTFTIFNLFLLFFCKISFAQAQQPYESTHGKQVGDFMAPYVTDFCKKENINPDTLKKIIFGTLLDNKSDTAFTPFMLSSKEHMTGNWIYYTANTPLIYEIKKQNDLVVILYSKLNPEKILTDKSSEWRIAVLDKKMKVIADKNFNTTWKYSNEYIAMWDMIYTNMMVSKSAIQVKITYVHTGTGGGRDQEFTVTANEFPKLNKIIVLQTKDLY